MKKLVTLGIAALLFGACAQALQARIIIPTNFGNGADAEVRDHQVATNFGSSTELASRIRNDFPIGDANDSGDRHSVMYLKFDLTGLTPADAVGAAVRLTVRNTNQIRRSEVYDVDNTDPDNGRNGLIYYGLPGATFDESTIAYFNAPGLTYDVNNGTKDWNGSQVYLGEVDFRLGSANFYAVGSGIELRKSAALDAFIAGEIATNPNGVAVIAVELRNQGLATEPGQWKNRNYLFNPKEMLTLNVDAGWDSDINDPDNPLGGPHSGASNADGRFSPSLILGVPEPTSLALMGLATVSILLNRRRVG